MCKIIIPLNAYRQSEIASNEYEMLFKVIKEAGAYGVELRRELLSHSTETLKKIKTSLDKYDLFTVFSAPIFLWKDDGAFNQIEMENVYEEASQVQAAWIKVSLGHYKKDMSDLNVLNEFIKDHSTQLLVENDQTLFGGKIQPLKQFFDQAALQSMNIKMTFDSGNWLYTNEDPIVALSYFSPHVLYLHLKDVVNENNHLITAPLSLEDHSNWKRFVKAFSDDVVKALEFPINPIVKTKDYVDLFVERKGEQV
ncbi:TIM barrel protein [Pullulanibacillus sp. KACC 23026]|uniref:sugar phosphate isomerase/epimerase family protein n=1 Tax=Pullulanibacillus sp. KACC 23026 TaxID=3028315 RepID=UPI0023AF50DB|nr:TIM barrel protein [Pullulanibacillus sp. KACC 23026]WEG10785.1 TIM barrel protein [Pullulanibacillus sp. KACC 23026]